MAPRVLVFGTGSLGTVYTWLLSRVIPESNITAICRSNYDEASKNGFTLNSTIWGNGLSVRPRIVRSISEATAQSESQPFDYVLVTTKVIPTTPSTAELIRPAITPGKTTIVVVHNGIGVEEEYARLYADDGVPILSVVAYLPATQISPAVVKHDVVEHSHIGTYPASPPPPPSGAPEPEPSAQTKRTAAAEAFVELLRAAGATATLHADVQAQRWAKLLINGAWNPICALTRLRDKQFVETRGRGRVDNNKEEKEEGEAAIFVRDVMREIAAVARACGYREIDDALVDRQIDRVREDGSVGIQPSMLADALDMRALEVDAIVGNTVRLAREKNVPVPLLRTLYLLTQGLSASFTLARL